MRTARVVDCGLTKYSEMSALLAESRQFGLLLSEVNALKPWGGYLRFAKNAVVPFLAAYWLDVNFDPPMDEKAVDPKMLLVGPKQMLSLQWHRRRGEIWRVIAGPVQVTIGDGWDTLSHRVYESGMLVEIPPMKWHRLIGLDVWGRVAELWDHTDAALPSDESDIIREHDIYGRADSQANAKWKNAYLHPSVSWLFPGIDR